MSAMGVRRDKAAFSSGCKPHPATAPAGSNRSSHGGDEVSNESEQSAQITTVADAPQITDKFTLYFGAGRVGRQCEVLWRGRHVIGAKFLTQTKSLDAGE